jgi:hypothetical protein
MRCARLVVSDFFRTRLGSGSDVRGTHLSVQQFGGRSNIVEDASNGPEQRGATCAGAVQPPCRRLSPGHQVSSKKIRGGKGVDVWG